MGKFIVIEGADGSGKTTQSKALAKSLDADWMCFPDRTTFYGKLIDAWLKKLWHGHSELTDAELVEQYHLPTERLIDAAMFQALQTMNRLELAKNIEAVRRSRRSVVCDRYWMSGYAYGSADGLDPELMVRVHTLLPEPDLVVLIDCPVEVIEARMRERTDTKRDLYESRPRSYFEKIHAAYDELWRLKGAVDKKWVRVPSTGVGTFAETQEALLRVVRSSGGT